MNLNSTEPGMNAGVRDCLLLLIKGHLTLMINEWRKQWMFTDTGVAKCINASGCRNESVYYSGKGYK